MGPRPVPGGVYDAALRVVARPPPVLVYDNDAAAVCGWCGSAPPRLGVVEAARRVLLAAAENGVARECRP